MLKFCDRIRHKLILIDEKKVNSFFTSSAKKHYILDFISIEKNFLFYSIIYLFSNYSQVVTTTYK